jgi:polyphosphate glucokinase
MRILVVDVGGSSVKLAIAGTRWRARVRSGPRLTAERMVARVRAAVGARRVDRVALGFPGPVVDGRPAKEPVNLGPGWVGFDYATAFGRPVRIENDAAMQARGAYRGGRMLFLGLGTGLGSTLVVDGVVVPMELGHLPYREGRTFEDFVGHRGYVRLGAVRWRRHVADVIVRLRAAFVVRDVVLGGGGARGLRVWPSGVTRAPADAVVRGGVRLWAREARPAARRRTRRN